MAWLLGGGKKKDKDKKKENAKPPAKDKSGTHTRMTTEDQINLALQVSLQESKGQPAQNSNPEMSNTLGDATSQSQGHSRMSTADQINLAVQMSLQEQESQKQKKAATEVADKPGHARMNTEQAIEIAIQQSLKESIADIPDGPPTQWTFMDLSNWIGSLNDDYERYADAIQEHEVDGKTFSMLEADDYVNINIRNANHRDNIFTAFRQILAARPDPDDADDETSTIMAPKKAPMEPLFEEPPPPEAHNNMSSPPPAKSRGAQESFGGVAGLFGGDDEDDDNDPDVAPIPTFQHQQVHDPEPHKPKPVVKESKPEPQAKPAAKPAAKSASSKASAPESFGGVYDLFGDENNPANIPTFSSPTESIQAEQNIERMRQNYLDAQGRIEELEKSLEGERRRANRLQDTVRKEQEARKLAESELRNMKNEKETKELTSQLPQQTEEPEDDIAAVALGFVSFKEDAPAEEAIHKRDPSFTGIAGLFDIDFDDSDPEVISDEPIQDPFDVTSGGPKKPKKKRDPSFSGVIDLFDNDEMAEMGFGPDAPKDPEPSSYSIPQKHKRDPSYTGVKDLFNDDPEDDDGMGFGFDSGEPAAGGSLRHKRDPSYTGVRDLFLEEEEEEAPMGQEVQLAELKQEITRQKRRIEELQKYESTNYAHVDTIETLEEDLAQKKALVIDLQRKAEDEKPFYRKLRQDAEEKSALLRDLRQKAEEREMEMQKEISKIRDEMLNQLKNSGSDVSELITNELERTKKELDEKEREIRELKNFENKASGKDVEIKHLKNTLQQERQTQQELQSEIDEADRRRKEADDKLRIIQESHTDNGEKDVLVKEKMRNKTLEDKNRDLNDRVDNLEKNINALTDSKMSLVRNAAMELDRLRSILQNVSDGNASIQMSSNNMS